MTNATTIRSSATNKRASEIVNRHIHAFLENDLDAVTADYADNAILVTINGNFRGPHAIKEFFRALIPHFPKGNSTFVLDKFEEQKNLVYIIWHGDSKTINVSFATDTFILQDGKIQQQTFAGQLAFLA